MATRDGFISSYWDGVQLIENFEEGGVIVRRQRQPSRVAILERGQRLARESREALKNEVAYLRPTACIPESDYDNLIRLNPDLRAPDAEIRARAWKAFLAGEGRCYVINPPRLDVYHGAVR